MLKQFCCTSGETIESFTEIIYAKQNDAQAQGSGITYARRYGLQSLVCVGANDDDGNAANAAKPKLTEKSKEFDRVCKALHEGKTDVEDLKKYFDITSVMGVFKEKGIDMTPKQKKEYDKKWYAENSEKKEYNRKWYAENSRKSKGV